MKEEHNTSHRKVRARVEHVLARMKGWKILRDCRRKGADVHHATLGIARLHNLALVGSGHGYLPLSAFGKRDVAVLRETQCAFLIGC